MEIQRVLFLLLIVFVSISCSQNEGLFQQTDIISLSSSEGFAGETIVIKADDMSFNKESIDLKVGDTKVPVQVLSESEISFKIPPQVEAGEVTLTLFVNGKACPTNPVLNVLTWKKLVNLPFRNRFSAFSFIFDNKIYMGLGRDLNNRTYNDFWEVDARTGTVRKLRDFPGAPRFFGLSFTLKSKGYIALGRDSTAAPLNELWEYDPKVDAWTRKADFPGSSRDEAAVFVLNNQAYIGNGLVNGTTFLRDFYKYDPGKNSWSAAPQFPRSRYAQASFVRDNQAYLVGGVTSEYRQTNEVWQFDGRNWRTRKASPGLGRIGGSGFSSGNISAAGFGITSENQAQRDLYLYTPKSDMWTRLSDFPGPDRFNPVAGASSRYWYFGAGYSLLSELNDLWVIDLNSRGYAK